MSGPTSEWIGALHNRVLAGKYRLLRVLGQGGMGAVFEAEQPALGRRVAVKLVLPRQQTSEKAMQRFAVEARAAARVADGGVPQVLDFDYDAELGPFQVIELLEGESLEARLARGALSPASTYAVLIEALAVLARVHAAGIVHRDIKPGNVFLEQRGDGARRVRLLDFGVARVRDAEFKITAQNTVLGTVGYVAPEAIAMRDVDHRADLYSVGMLLWSCLTGQQPFPGLTPAQVFAAVTAGQVPSLRAARPDLAARLHQVYEWATAYDPNRRPPSAEAFATELRRAQLDESHAALAGGSTPAPAAYAQPGASATPARAPAAATFVSGEMQAGGTPPPSHGGASRSYAPHGAAPSHATPHGAAPVYATPAPGHAAVAMPSGGASVSPAVSVAPSRGRAWIMPVALGVTLAALVGTASVLLYVLNERGQGAGDGGNTPIATPPLTPLAADAGASTQLPVPPPADPALDATRSALASASALLEQRRVDEAIAAFERVRTSLMEPAPPVGSPRAELLGRAYLGLGDAHRARVSVRAATVPRVASMQNVLAATNEYLDCFRVTQDDQTAAQGAYQTLMSDARFAELRQCAETRMGRLYDEMSEQCGRVREAREAWIGTALLYLRMADRPGPCSREAAEHLARVRSLPNAPPR